jgi:effector-binding domain-containing protein
MKKLFVAFVCCIALMMGASFNKQQIITTVFSSSQTYKDTTVRIVLEQTNIHLMKVLFVTDTAVTTKDIKTVLAKGYGELMQMIHQYGLAPQKFIACYKTSKQPWVIDIATEVNEIPEKTSGRIHTKIIQGGEVVIAHIWGPYNEVGKAYTAIEEWLKANNRKAKDFPFEVYVNDPYAVKSPYDIQTDVYQLIE